ncbi:MAG: metal-dependent hydrolase [Candidatus Heimdallarchaeaceae archaeon]
MDSVTHGSVSVLIGLIFTIFNEEQVPLWLLLIVLFVFGILVDYDHYFYYKKQFPHAKVWNLPQLIKLYFKTIDDRDQFIYHTWLQEPFGVLVVSGLSFLIFKLPNFYPSLTYLAIGVYSAHYLVDLFSGKMKPFAPFNSKITIDLKILPANSFTAAGLTLLMFLVGLFLFFFIGIPELS